MNKKHLFYFGFVLMTLIGLQSCRTTEEITEEKPTELSKIAFKNNASGYLTGNGAEGITEGGIVINSEAEWDALAKKMNSVNDAIKNQSIDFNKMTVLAYFDQIRGSGGYSVEFASISRTGQLIQAITKKTPATGDNIEIMTQPYTIVLIDKTNMAVVFIEE